MFHFLSPNCTNLRQLTCLACERYVLENVEISAPQVTRLARWSKGVSPMAKVPAKKPPATVASEPQELENQIRQRAFELYEARGREEGHDLEDWLRAEEEITAKSERAVAA